jgi:hypothetical protein
VRQTKTGAIFAARLHRLRGRPVWAFTRWVPRVWNAVRWVALFLLCLAFLFVTVWNVWQILKYNVPW